MCGCVEKPRVSFFEGTATITDTYGRAIALPIQQAVNLEPVPLDKIVGWVRVSWGETALQMRPRHWQEVKAELEKILACCKK